MTSNGPRRRLARYVPGYATPLCGRRCLKAPPASVWQASRVLVARLAERLALEAELLAVDYSPAPEDDIPAAQQDVEWASIWCGPPECD